MNPTIQPSARMWQLAAIATAAAVLTACAAPQDSSSSNNASVTPKPAPTVPAEPLPATPVANAGQLLPQYTWSLMQVTGRDGMLKNDWLIADKAAPVLAFQNNQMSVQNLCNIVNAGYRLTDAKIEVQRPMSTMRACVDDAAMAQERKVITQLPLAQRFEVMPADANTPIRMALFFSDGLRWDLQGSPTPATRFGSTPQRIFLEVAPEKVSCNHPLMRDAKCLRVRDLSYDAQGIKHVKGDWYIFQGDIEGYKFESGMRNVLRVDRYTINYGKNGMPADAPKYAHVLDMVVESERTR